jgi:hypothetical protein
VTILIRYGALGIIGYLTPRILVGAGVPLDEWGISFGEWLGASKPWIEEWGLTLIGALLTIILTGFEAWWQPVKRGWESLFGNVVNPTAPPLIRDWNMQQAMHWWNEHIGEAAGKDPVVFFSELRQFARDGTIKIWGRPECVGLTLSDYPDRPYEMIPPEHWRDYDFDWMRYIFGDTEELIREAMTPESDVIAERYADLCVTSTEVKALWPAASTSVSKKPARQLL